jgi:hypothetical protein
VSAKSFISDEMQVFSKANLDDISNTSEAIENKLPHFVTQFTLQNISIILPKASTKPQKIPTIYFEGNPYQILIGNLIHDKSVMAITVQSPSNPTKRFSQKTERLGLNGLLSKIVVKVQEGCPVNKEIIAKLAKVLVETTYEWIQKQLNQIIFKSSLHSNYIYDQIALLMPNKKCMDYLWLVGLNEKNGSYILNSNIVRKSIDRISNQARDFNESPTQIIVTLLTTVLPFEETNSKIAINQDDCININTRDSLYVDDENIFTLAEIALFGTENISIYPIVREGNTYFLAVFPTNQRKEIELVLDENEKRLNREFNLFSSKYKRLKATYMRSKFAQADHGARGAFWGGFVTEAVKNLSRS